MEFVLNVSAQKILRIAQVFLAFFDVENCDEIMNSTSIPMYKKFLAWMRLLQHFLDQKMLKIY